MKTPTRRQKIEREKFKLDLVTCPPGEGLETERLFRVLKLTTGQEYDYSLSRETRYTATGERGAEYMLRLKSETCRYYLNLCVRREKQGNIYLLGWDGFFESPYSRGARGYFSLWEELVQERNEAFLRAIAQRELTAMDDRLFCRANKGLDLTGSKMEIPLGIGKKDFRRLKRFELSAYKPHYHSFELARELAREPVTIISTSFKLEDLENNAGRFEARFKKTSEKSIQRYIQYLDKQVYPSRVECRDFSGDRYFDYLCKKEGLSEEQRRQVVELGIHHRREDPLKDLIREVKEK